MFADFNKFRMTFGDLKYVKCTECNKKHICEEIKKYKDETYQPVNNYNYFKNYGCYIKKEVEQMDEKEYIESLENLLIFMCKTYDGITDNLLELFQKGNDAYLKIPTIQGTRNIVSVYRLGTLDIKDIKYGFKDVLKEILNKRGEK